MGPMGRRGDAAVQAIAGFCLILFILTVTVVGVRMLLLTRRTRGLHEFLMGLGMVLIGTLGFPASLASGFGGPVGQMSIPIWFCSSLVTMTGLGLIYAFTWQAFRPREAWGKAIVVTGAAFMLTGLLVSLHGLLTAPPDAMSQLVARNGVFLGMAGYCGCFLWSAVEGFVHYGNARKRLALGLADAVVVNRFWLWGIFGLMATGINVSSAIGAALGVDPSQSPLVLIPMGVLGFIASAAMYLAFLPPASYLAFVRSRFASAQ
jgi:hypothetical protein